jgi:hypothetical protein
MPEHVPNELLADDLRQELVQDEPLVVPRCQPARRREHVHRIGQAPLLAHVVDRTVVEQ